MKAPIPPNEEARLAALRRYRLLDTAAERAFDDITLLASTVCGTPMALISLVDAERQWFKSRRGLDVDQTPREQAFCAHAILDTATLVVEDARLDRRFADNPLVTGQPELRFYAGAPLIDREGYALGTLCVLDRQPRQIDAHQRNCLEALSRQVIEQLELRRTADELAAALEDVKTLRELLPLCAWCREVRDDDGYWSTLEHYLVRHHGADVSHGICPACYQKMLGKARPG
jgi:GAF domain-containing protein